MVQDFFHQQYHQEESVIPSSPNSFWGAPKNSARIQQGHGLGRHWGMGRLTLNRWMSFLGNWTACWNGSVAPIGDDCLTWFDLIWFDLIWLIELEFDWLNSLASGWSKDPLNYWLMGLIGWLVACLTRWRVERFTDWSVGWLIDWRTWRTDRMKWNGMERNGTERNGTERNGTNKRMNEWMNTSQKQNCLNSLCLRTVRDYQSWIIIFIYTYKHSTYLQLFMFAYTYDIFAYPSCVPLSCICMSRCKHVEFMVREGWHYTSLKAVQTTACTTMNHQTALHPYTYPMSCWFIDVKWY